MCERYLIFILVHFMFGGKMTSAGGGITSPGGEVVGGEVTCGSEMVGEESFWWWDDRKPSLLSYFKLTKTLKFHVEYLMMYKYLN